jgi:hypothetical protein
LNAHDRHHLDSQFTCLPRQVTAIGVALNSSILLSGIDSEIQRKSQSETMAAFPQTMPQSAYNRAIPPPTTMNAPYPMYQPAMTAPPGAMAMNMVPAAGAMPPRAGGRAPQGYYSNPAAPPVNPSAPMKGTLRPGEKIRVGNHSVVIEKYLSEGEFKSLNNSTSTGLKSCFK